MTPGRDYSCIRTAPVVFGCEGQGREEFRSPHGIAFDSDGSVVVSDMINNRIKVSKMHARGLFASVALSLDKLFKNGRDLNMSFC